MEAKNIKNVCVELHSMVLGKYTVYLCHFSLL